MPKLQATTTTEVTQNVMLQPKVHQMLKERCEEDVRLAADIKKLKERRGRIGKEVQELFAKAKQGKALVDGTDIDGHRVKMVFGSSTRLDKEALMKAHGLTQEDLDECSETKDNKPYVKISKPGAKGDDDE